MPTLFCTFQPMLILLTTTTQEASYQTSMAGYGNCGRLPLTGITSGTGRTSQIMKSSSQERGFSWWKGFLVGTQDVIREMWLWPTYQQTCHYVTQQGGSILQDSRGWKCTSVGQGMYEMGFYIYIYICYPGCLGNVELELELVVSAHIVWPWSMLWGSWHTILLVSGPLTLERITWIPEQTFPMFTPKTFLLDWLARVT